MDHVRQFCAVGEVKQSRVGEHPFFLHASWSGRFKHFKVSSCKQTRQIFLEELAGGLAFSLKICLILMKFFLFVQGLVKVSKTLLQCKIPYLFDASHVVLSDERNLQLYGGLSVLR